MTRVFCTIALLSISVCSGFNALAQENTLQAGMSVTDITPEPGLPLWGYGDRGAPAQGTLDPLYAKAIVFRVGSDTAAIVSLDLGRPPVAEVKDRILKRVRKKGVNSILLVASHTHHGPYMELSDEPYALAIEQKIGDTIEAAVATLEPVRVGIGRTQIDIAHNRRKHLEDGRVMMLWRNEERIPTEPVDEEASIIKIDRADGTPMALLVHYACHPVVMGPSNLEFSADYVGEMGRIVKEQTGAECIFLQGGCGDINPYMDKTPLSDDGVEVMRSVGRDCAAAILGKLSDIETKIPSHPSVAVSEQMIEVGIRWDLENSDQVNVLKSTMGDRYFDFYIANKRRDLSVPLIVLVLNNDLAFVGMPGEIFVHYQLALKKQSPLKNTFLLGYTNEYHAYFPTVFDAAAGGYGANVASYVGLGAADKLFVQGLIEIGKLTGRFKDFHPIEDFILVEAE